MNQDADRSVLIVTHLLLATMKHRDSDRDSGNCVTEGHSVFDRRDASDKSHQKRSFIEIEPCSVMPKIAYHTKRSMTSTLSFAHSRCERIFSSEETDFDRDMVPLKLLAEWK